MQTNSIKMDSHDAKEGGGGEKGGGRRRRRRKASPYTLPTSQLSALGGFTGNTFTNAFNLRELLAVSETFNLRELLAVSERYGLNQLPYEPTTVIHPYYPKFPRGR